jgi:hypothetical protein
MPMSAKREAAATLPVESSPAHRFLPLETIPVRLLSPPYTDRRQVFGIISNMSQTGACLITNRSLPVDARIRVEIRSAREPSVSMVSARIVWCAERLEPVKEIIGYLTGVSFDSDPDAADIVRALLQSGIFQSIP